MSLDAFRRRLWDSHRQAPAEWTETLPGQRAFRDATVDHEHVVLFGANVTGKTYGVVHVLLDVLQGRHPRWTRPIDVLLCVTGWHSISSKAFARALYRLSPPGLLGQQDLDPQGRPIGRLRPWYSPQRGFAGSPPRLVVLRGPMAGSQVDLTTLGAGPAHSTGGTYPLVIVDEPITQQEHAELAGRGRGVNGSLWYLFTPTEDAPDQAWAKDLCEKGLAYLVQVELTPESLVLSSGRRLEPWDETSARIARWPESERDMRCGRSWKPILGRSYFSDVWSSSVVVPFEPAGQMLIAGVDHSTRAGRTRICVSAFSDKDSLISAHTIVDVKSETADLDTTARIFLDALDSAGLRLEDIDAWIGDRVAMDKQLVRRDNMQLRAAILRAWHARGNTDCPPTLTPDRFRQPKKRRGSHLYRLSYMRSMLAETRWRIAPECRHLPSDVVQFDGRDQSPCKDGLDAVGYSIELYGVLMGLWVVEES